MGKITVCAPSRVYEDYPGGRFSMTAMVDYFHRVGISGIDMSFENLSRLEESWRSVLYGVARRAQENKISIPLCHLSFYMPDPKNPELMTKYFGELKRGVDAAALMGIKYAVAHPIALESSKHTYGDWVRANMGFYSPLVEYANQKGVKICMENMPSRVESESNHLYGSCALNISAIAAKLGAGICWDVGHANISGFNRDDQMEILKGKIDVLHIHDNNGLKDSHLMPFDGQIDWENTCRGLKIAEFEGIMSVEFSAWSVSGDAFTREEIGKRIVSRARRILNMIENN